MAESQIGTPVVQPSYDNTSKDEFITGSIGAPVLEDNRDVANLGVVASDPNDNRSLQVELGGTGAPVASPDARTNLPNPIDDPNSRKNIEVEFSATSTTRPVFGTEVTLLGTVLNFNP